LINNIKILYNYINEIIELKEKNYYEYDEWKIFHNLDMLKIVINSLHEKIEKTNISFDHIGALGGSGTPLAMSLSLKYFNEGNKKHFFYISDPLIGISSTWLRKMKPDVTNASILLVDTETKSGRTILDGYNKIEKYEVGNLKGIAVITDFIGFNDREDYNKVVNQNKIPIIKLFDFDPYKNKLSINY